MLKLELNETLIHERPLDQAQNRVFGLYHDKGRTEARVRSVVLEGNWPKTPPLTSDALLATVGPVDEGTRRFRHAVLDEATLVLNAGEVLRRSASCHRHHGMRRSALGPAECESPDLPPPRQLHSESQYPSLGQSPAERDQGAPPSNLSP